MRTKSDLRSTIFRHLDGIVTAPTSYSLYKHGVLDYLSEHVEARVSDLATQFKANEGYLNVALRVLCSQGWLTMKVEPNDVVYRTNSKSHYAFALVPL